jgi:transposase-like protein
VSTSPTGVQLKPACPACACKNTVKKGKRRNRLQTLQVFRCSECLHRFTGSPGKNKTYPFKLVLEAISENGSGVGKSAFPASIPRLLRTCDPGPIPGLVK